MLISLVLITVLVMLVHKHKNHCRHDFKAVLQSTLKSTTVWAGTFELFNPAAGHSGNTVKELTAMAN